MARNEASPPTTGRNKNGETAKGSAVNPIQSVEVGLDHIDLGRQVGRHFKTNFLLTHFRLRPDLHIISSKFDT